MNAAPSILITDDDRSLRETLQCVFEPKGFRTLLAADGEQAIRIVQSEPVHVVLVDLHMPRLSGLETIHHIRSQRLMFPCILMSAEADENEVAEALNYGGVSFLRKPVTCQHVTQAVTGALAASYPWPL